MPSTLGQIIDSGNTVSQTNTLIIEPLDPQATFGDKLLRFNENYNLNVDSHLYRFLSALCGEAGAGGLKKELLYTRLQQWLDSTHFTDLDRLYGDALALPRLSEELYSVDPTNDILTQAQWQEVRLKDARYRARCLLWMRAIMEGSTINGIKLAVESATGLECDVFERFRYLENSTSLHPITIANIGYTTSPNEFVIIPHAPAITQRERRRIMRLVDRLRPTNTIPTLYDGDYIRNERPVTQVSSTSSRFNILHYVIGRSDITWPAPDPIQGYWITSTEENEAPLKAFMDRQESVTFITIISATATSEHVGKFNKMQQDLFGNLRRDFPDYEVFDASQSFAVATAPLNTSLPWIDRTDTSSIIINNYYPIGYFSQPNVPFYAADSTSSFWASEEQLAPISDTLTYDLGRARPVNFIDFNLSQKPIDFSIEYFDGTNWLPVAPVEEFPLSTSVDYLPSLDNPWAYIEAHFDVVTTQFIRIVFTRREQRFPLPTSDFFPWSIEVRNLRIMNLITSISDFTPDFGVDILGNSYRTDIVINEPKYVIDQESTSDDVLGTFWQSQPNPSRMAVEALYFDLRSGWNVGTQAYLDGFIQRDLDTRSQADMELYYELGVVLDEVFVDPITVGVDMHFYYSLDDTPDWDNKLWIPIPRAYVSRKGYHALPSPTFTKYFKIEFTNLAAAPYQPVDYPLLPPVEWRRHPTWVQNYFEGLYPIDPLPSDGPQTVSIDPFILGYQTVLDKYSTSFADMRSTILRDTDSEIAQAITNLGLDNSSSDTASTIRFYTPLLWQEDLITQLDPNSALSRHVQQPHINDDTGWSVELGLPTTPPVTQQSVPTANLIDVYSEKNAPVMWFPRACRHQYQIIHSPFLSKIAYYVAIRTVSFYRRDYTVLHDETVYTETLQDVAHVERNDFTLALDYGFRIAP